VPSPIVEIQVRILRFISPRAPTSCSGGAYEGKSKLAVLFGSGIFDQLHGKVVVDFGCGEGNDAVEMARMGARRVIGLDIREDVLETARENAERAGVANVCSFATAANELADIIVSLDAFEHFSEPAKILQVMEDLLRPRGEVLISFGPTWYHPLGGHLFSVFPWAHLLFSEEALIRWRSGFRTDGATRFSEVAGGLNQMTIRRFERLIEASQFCLSSFELVPIRKLRPLHNSLTREFTTAIVRCRLVRKAKNPGRA
jgi:SAM-dependent methyltransferase